MHSESTATPAVHPAPPSQHAVLPQGHRSSGPSCDTTDSVAVTHPSNQAPPHIAALNRFGAAVSQLCQSDNIHEHFVDQLAGILHKHLGADIIAHVAGGDRPDQHPRLRVLRSSVEPIAESLQRWCLSFGARCISTGQTLLENDAVRTSVQLFATPLACYSDAERRDCLVLLFASPPADRHFHAAALSLLDAHIAGWSAKQIQRNATALTRQLAAITDLVSHIESAEDIEAAANQTAEQLLHHLQVSHFVFATCAGSGTVCRIRAIAGQTGLEQESDPDRLPQAVLQESISRGSLATWPPDSQDRHALLAHKQYAAATGVEQIVSCPLIDNSGQIHGAWMACGTKLAMRHSRAARFLSAASSPIASSLQLLERAHQNRFHRGIHRGIELLQKKKGRAILTIVAAVLTMLLIPFHYKVAADCELQPVSRRFVAAPYDGKLDTSLVQPGDVVAKDQLIARMDGREINWELAQVDAELHRALKERAGHVAAHESGKARLAGHEVERLRSKQEMLRNRTTNLEIRSPFAGIVVTGDLTKSAGIPLQVGQTLFEIAPLDRMVVELSIPEDDVRFVQTGMTVDIRLDAFPFRKWKAKIQRVHPRAELKNNENVFIAEAMIDNVDSTMRPGMRGSCKVVTSPTPLGWNLFHKALATAIRWVGC